MEVILVVCFMVPSMPAWLGCRFIGFTC